jgi:hypothetical protein
MCMASKRLCGITQAATCLDEAQRNLGADVHGALVALKGSNAVACSCVRLRLGKELLA